MEDQNLKEKTVRSLESLKERQWRVIDELCKRLDNEDLTTLEFTRAAKTLADHINILHKLEHENRENKETNEPTLGDFVASVKPRTHRRWDPRAWTRRLSFKRS